VWVDDVEKQALTGLAFNTNAKAGAIRLGNLNTASTVTYNMYFDAFRMRADSSF